MKRAPAICIATLVLLFTTYQYTQAQDDIYYDPNKDQSNQPTYPTIENSNSHGNSNSQQEELQDNRDGYESPAMKYDEPDNSESYQSTGNTYITNNYYDDDDDDFGYTSRIRRYYTPNFGVDYYSYWFTPSFYFGWNSWNSNYLVSVNPWYSDPWWGWNRRSVAVIYDPFYDPYWSWNFGWNSCSYYNSWSNPYGGWGGYNNWGGGGFCGGYGGGWGGYGGYNNGYWNGYNQGYYNGYNDGYWNGSAYNNNTNYYNGPRRHRSSVTQETSSPSTVNPPAQNPGNPKPGFGDKNANVYIPREGIQKPYTAKEIKPQPGGVSIESVKPYNPSNPNVVKPGPGSVEEKINTLKPKSEQPISPEVKPNTNNWEHLPENRYNRPQPDDNRNIPSRPEINTKENIRPREEMELQQRPRNIERSQPERIEQPRPAEPRRFEQPRNVEQPRNAPERQIQRSGPEPRNYNPQPQRQEMRRMERSPNIQAVPQQRNFSPSQGGGNMRRKP
ncbi:MAG: hypothetical protein V4615_09450 [Bacteroidota bacterium]